MTQVWPDGDDQEWDDDDLWWGTPDWESWPDHSEEASYP